MPQIAFFSGENNNIKWQEPVGTIYLTPFSQSDANKFAPLKRVFDVWYSATIDTFLNY
jgi:hypothetical protein